MAKIEPFETHTDRYDAWFEDHKWVYESELEAIRYFINQQDKSLEVGVGTGRFAIPLGVHTGIDPSPRMAGIAVERGINAIVGTGEDMPFNDNVFDCVLIVTTICFFDNALQALKESHRVLKDTGSIVIGFVDRESPIGRKYSNKKDKSVFYREAHFYSVSEVTDLLEKALFGDFQIVQTVFGKLDEISSRQAFQEGYGKGSFVVIRGFRKIAPIRL